MHTSMMGKRDFFQGAMYETLLKAEVATAGAQKPYVFAGFITPAYIPIEEIIGMGGVGLATHTPIHQQVALRTDSSIATTLLKIGRGQETVLQSNLALEIEPREATKLQVGFNLFQDMRRKEYHTWWSMTASYTF